MWQGQVRQLDYLAQPEDNTLGSLLIESFKLLELRFEDYDVDKVQVEILKTCASYYYFYYCDYPDHMNC